MYDPFWNVVVVKSDLPGADGVVYGYAFRHQWLWHNNYGTNGRTYVIWKDYNCLTIFNYDSPITVAGPGSSGVNLGSLRSVLGDYVGIDLTPTEVEDDDVWKVAQAINTRL